MEEQNISSQTPAPQTEQNQTPPAPQNPAPIVVHKSSGIWSKLSWIIIVILLIIIIIFGGYFALNQNKQNQSPSPTPIGSPEPTAQAADPTANWKEFISEEYGFSIKYPYEVSHDTTIEDSRQINRSHEFFRINGGTLEIYGLCGRGIGAIKTTAIIIAGQETTKFYETETQGAVKAIDRPHSNESVCFSFTLPDDSNKESVDKLFDQILSTFKFTDSKDSFCGGIAAVACPNGYTCKLDGDYPDAGGTCVVD